jgi:CubicO group peptidase (beta-lactamase class C family)
LTYEFRRTHPVDQMYRDMGYDFGQTGGANLEKAVNDWCSNPLLFEPGTQFNYSVATDVLARLIEIWSGQPLDVFLKERVLEPLGMFDTDFWCLPDKQERLAMLYLHYAGETFPWDDMAKKAARKPRMLSGGGGLGSTAYDYQRFMTMLLRGGELDGVRLVSSRTLELMTQNHLPGDVDLQNFAIDSYADVDGAGIGFGLGFAVVTDSIRNKSLISEGSFYWGGAASTIFWVDPADDLTVGFYTQVVPTGFYPLRRELEQLVYQALVD